MFKIDSRVIGELSHSRDDRQEDVCASTVRPSAKGKSEFGAVIISTPQTNFVSEYCRRFFDGLRPRAIGRDVFDLTLLIVLEKAPPISRLTLPPYHLIKIEISPVTSLCTTLSDRPRKLFAASMV